jgi:selenide,water dikinase
LNRPGVDFAELPGVHAMTDVTGFGLAGHLLEMCRGSNLQAALDWSSVPVMDEARALVQAGIYTGASTRNWAAYGSQIQAADGAANMPDWQRHLLSDPQTSGGLLLACDPATEAEVHALFARGGFAEARTIGRMLRGEAGITLAG